MLHAQIPSESQRHGSADVQNDPSAFKEPSMKQPQSKVLSVYQYPYCLCLNKFECLPVQLKPSLSKLK